MKIIAFLLAFGVLAGCATKPQDLTCRSADWFEYGRRDGATGQASSQEALRKTCGSEFSLEAEKFYTNGYNKGLVEFCTLENGYSLGRAGKSMPTACPELLEHSFRLGFSRGKRALELENANSNIERKISSINEQLSQNKVQSKDKKALSTELKQLKTRLDMNNQELSRIEKTTRNL